MSIKFSDGVTIATDGPYRPVLKADGWYVIGKGMCCPVDSLEEALDMIRELTKK